MADKVKVIGGMENFWLYSEAAGYDITHPPTPDSPKVYPRLSVQTKEDSVILDPTKTALVIVDLQNYFLSPALGRPADSAGLQVVEKLKTVVIPACRKAGITILWLEWGLTQKDIDKMPPTLVKGFAQDSNFEADRKIPGLGVKIGPVKLGDGTIIEAGKALMQDEWNSNTYEPLATLFEPSDLRIYKNRLSGFWGGTQVEQALKSRGIRTLILAGCNTDQCVASSLIDAMSKSWDCLMLSDACATTSPKFAKDMVEYNMGGWGFLLTCENLADGIGTLKTSPTDESDE
ncbi:Isochorismatase hydrolase [Lophiostoma macrostomum CBS 122681]|uniref:Isochorismatase hydrolase n=1 Tax=Lophiostoma macrostomum CBS 122681 TaxID=1314788 RepID=A0A6A6SX87_9PLEO|nr:Isochorismatase hydrolase [Lophiostoma macrostomum CBS 122681]